MTFVPLDSKQIEVFIQLLWPFHNYDSVSPSFFSLFGFFVICSICVLKRSQFEEDCVLC